MNVSKRFDAIALDKVDVERHELASIRKDCTVCGGQSIVFGLGSKLSRWSGGELIQNVWPDVTVADREVLISGVHGECFDLLTQGSEIDEEETDGV